MTDNPGNRLQDPIQVTSTSLDNASDAEVLTQSGRSLPAFLDPEVEKMALGRVATIRQELRQRRASSAATEDSPVQGNTENLDRIRTSTQEQVTGDSTGILKLSESLSDDDILNMSDEQFNRLYTGIITADPDDVFEESDVSIQDAKSRQSASQTQQKINRNFNAAKMEKLQGIENQLNEQLKSLKGVDISAEVKKRAGDKFLLEGEEQELRQKVTAELKGQAEPILNMLKEIEEKKQKLAPSKEEQKQLEQEIQQNSEKLKKTTTAAATRYNNNDSQIAKTLSKYGGGIDSNDKESLVKMKESNIKLDRKLQLAQLALKQFQMAGVDDGGIMSPGAFSPITRHVARFSTKANEAWVTLNQLGIEETLENVSAAKLTPVSDNDFNQAMLMSNFGGHRSLNQLKVGIQALRAIRGRRELAVQFYERGLEQGLSLTDMKSKWNSMISNRPLIVDGHVIEENITLENGGLSPDRARKKIAEKEAKR